MRAFRDAAVGLGAEVLHEPVLHEPRLWPEYHERYFGAFVRDPDGNNVEAVCHSGESSDLAVGRPVAGRRPLTRVLPPPRAWIGSSCEESARPTRPPQPVYMESSSEEYRVSSVLRFTFMLGVSSSSSTVRSWSRIRKSLMVSQRLSWPLSSWMQVPT